MQPAVGVGHPAVLHVEQVLAQAHGQRAGLAVGDGTPGPISMRLREALLDIQHGRVADTHGWLHRVA